MDADTDSTDTTGVDTDAIVARAEKHEKFHADCQRELKKLLAYQELFDSMIDYDIELPYDAAYGRSSYVNVAQHHYGENGEYQLDEKATIQQFARITRWARDKGYTIKKEYKNDEFGLYVETNDSTLGTFNFYSTRQVVCKKVVTGKKIVPATPEHEEEEVEWVCDKIAFLNVEV